ncbi:MAG: 50S ribosomal protein L5 [Candidatus Zambryskibacteria bacterium RIFCSPLOWO2_02_FULL_51_21]|uniref:Large ribosomal subunit protein uL5 n=1 Tax=Candidatus Zambryskibacteria bacterium RIFCSPHIGHO2_02_FULL_43_37 TaxID=1802749 RepID=A0A1G2TIH8_9BACT|nr:MAG: 50S ribosomal protein L5 [Candidatus Zambryskibacteria bacterium RIFCSPHIGHO2_01_FULL_52_18]OHA96421.1 MAG: 50S ribosomal protein L5 [Candidatus Zambryskibacteria bacterium RIFCSPHIGHO2_02_FULL_43_37]OHB07367.1 MAG: 50S ribosomal protein L5 [Candidatus Zambryskibacteria bacterium RIFCSPLOWO2_01_FULL_52_12]OHB11319.1 MAG: 50S ribosomal protein L5 [Candidatus Zambryskibacteria bacterium RIFCSPLOWO2_02_FULL_51_21]
MASLKEKTKKMPGYKNPMQAPRLMKVVVSAGVGSFKDKNKFKIVEDRLARITGQKAAPRGAKVSIATFKSREGDVVGYQATLRGKRMHDFLEKLIHIALPRTKDFRGIPLSGADEMGNYTLGVKEHTIFPETSDEELKDVFGFAVTIVTTAKSKDEVIKFMTHLGFPFKK